MRAASGLDAHEAPGLQQHLAQRRLAQADRPADADADAQRQQAAAAAADGVQRRWRRRVYRAIIETWP